MADLITFKICSNFTDEEATLIAVARGVSAAVCCGIMSFVLVALVILCVTLPKSRNRLCGTVIKRLAFGIIAVGVAYQLNLALHLVHYYNPRNPDINRYCKVNGFFNQYLSIVLVLSLLEIILILFFKINGKLISSWRSFYKLVKAKGNKSIYHGNGWKINRMEVLNLALILVLPLVFDWIPFTTNSYGQSGPWCWIIIVDQDCSRHMAGFWEQIWLWHVPFAVATFLVLVLYIASLCVLGYGVKHTEAYKWIKVGILDYVLLLTFLFFALLVALVEIGRFAFDQLRVDFWVVVATVVPLIATLNPLALLVAIHLPISSTIFRIRQSRILKEGELRTVNESDSSLDTPYTTWTPPHSSITTDASLLQLPDELQQD